MDVYLLDGTYELFRHYFGQPARAAADGAEVGAVRGVVVSVLGMLAQGVTHIGVATDHVIESFRNNLWPGYKDGTDVPEALRSQFELLERALEELGVVVWPMVDTEADDALASAAALAAAEPGVGQVRVCTPDKDLAQCVTAARVVQLDRRTGLVTDEEGVRSKFGVAPGSIPDWLALVGDAADGFPGLSGWGRRSAAVVLAHYGTIEAIPDDARDWDAAVRGEVRAAPRLASTLATGRDRAELFKVLATLRTDLPVLDDVEELRWRGPADGLEEVGRYLRDEAIARRAAGLARR